MCTVFEAVFGLEQHITLATGLSNSTAVLDKIYFGELQTPIFSR